MTREMPADLAVRPRLLMGTPLPQLPGADSPAPELNPASPPPAPPSFPSSSEGRHQHGPPASSSRVSHSVVSGPCDPTNCSSPGSSVHGILQARVLEWVAIPFCSTIHFSEQSQKIPSNCECRFACPVACTGPCLVTFVPQHSVPCLALETCAE